MCSLWEEYPSGVRPPPAGSGRLPPGSPYHSLYVLDNAAELQPLQSQGHPRAQAAEHRKTLGTSGNPITASARPTLSLQEGPRGPLFPDGIKPAGAGAGERAAAVAPAGSVLRDKGGLGERDKEDRVSTGTSGASTGTHRDAATLK